MVDKLTVTSADGAKHAFNEMGIKSLRRLCKEAPELLKGASVEDIVVGKGAAAFMIYGGVVKVHAGVLSKGAKEMLAAANVEVSCDTEVEKIINREGCKQCGIESLLVDTVSVSECVKRISEHFNDQWSL